MSTGSELPNLHDAILLSVRVEWADAVATVELERLPGIAVVLVASGLREFSMTHREEWGPSISVNGVVLMNQADENTLTIEMQSGDTIRLVAAGVEVS